MENTQAQPQPVAQATPPAATPANPGKRNILKDKKSILLIVLVLILVVVVAAVGKLVVLDSLKPKAGPIPTVSQKQIPTVKPTITPTPDPDLKTTLFPESTLNQ